MSKAFTKEDSNDSADDLDEAPDQKLPIGQKNYMTPSCAEKLRAELKTLLTQTRPEIVRTVAWAASNGDRSENGLTKRLDNAAIVDPLDQARGPNASRALFGATLDVLHEDGETKTYSIVGIDEAAPAQGRVSWISPIAKALLNSKVGDVVTLRSPRGEEDLEVVAVRYVELK